MGSKFHQKLQTQPHENLRTWSRGMSKNRKICERLLWTVPNQNGNVIYLSNAKVLCLSIHIFFQSYNSPRLDIQSQTFTNNDLLFFSCRKKVQGAISIEPECWGVSSWWLFIQKIWEGPKVEIIIQTQTTSREELYQQISMWLQWTFQNLVVFKDMRF